MTNASNQIKSDSLYFPEMSLATGNGTYGVTATNIAFDTSQGRYALITSSTDAEAFGIGVMANQNSAPASINDCLLVPNGRSIVLDLMGYSHLYVAPGAVVGAGSGYDTAVDAIAVWGVTQLAACDDAFPAPVAATVVTPQSNASGTHQVAFPLLLSGEKPNRVLMTLASEMGTDYIGWKTEPDTSSPIHTAMAVDHGSLGTEDAFNSGNIEFLNTQGFTGISYRSYDPSSDGGEMRLCFATLGV